ncbi:MAG: glutamine--tRNA ligase, partial [Anaeromyxobacteraceae bacterium]
YAVRQDLEPRCPRALAVLDPLRVELSNWPAGKVEELEIPWWPGEPARGARKVPFGGALFVEREDFAEEPPADWKRLAPGREVRLAGAYVIRCDEVVRGPDGTVESLRCTVDLGSREGGPRRGLGTLHWLDAARSVPAEVRLYDRLFRVEQPDAEPNFLDALNPASLRVAADARVEPALAGAEPGTRYQFLRQGWFIADPVDSHPGAPVWNRTITLKDTWAARQEKAPAAHRKPQDPSPASKATRAPAPAARVAAIPRVLDAEAAAYLDAAVAAGADRDSATRWFVNDLAGLAKGRAAELALDPPTFGRFVALTDRGRVTTAGAKTLLASLVERAGEPAQRAKELGVEKVEDRAAIGAAVDEVLAAHGDEVTRYRAGEKKLLGVLVGAAMKRTAGSADAGLIRALLAERLGS